VFPFSCALVCMFLCTVALASPAGGLPYTWLRTKLGVAFVPRDMPRMESRDDLNHACMRETIPGIMMLKYEGPGPLRHSGECYMKRSSAAP